MVKLVLVLVICAALIGASYAGARLNAGSVVGDGPNNLGTMTSRFEFKGIAGLPGQPRGWVLAYPQAPDMGKGGAEIYVSITGHLLGTRPADLADKMLARKRADP